MRPRCSCRGGHVELGRHVEPFQSLPGTGDRIAFDAADERCELGTPARRGLDDRARIGLIPEDAGLNPAHPAVCLDFFLSRRAGRKSQVSPEA